MVTRQPTHPEPQGADADLPLDPIGFDHGLEGLAILRFSAGLPDVVQSEPVLELCEERVCLFG